MTKKTRKEVQIIVTKTLHGGGKKSPLKNGSLVVVKSGYARNYLIPQQFAEIATSKSLKNLELLQKKAEKQEKLFIESSKEKKAILEQSSEFILRRRSSEDNKIFGKIAPKQIIDLLEKTTDLDLKDVQLSLPEIKELGIFPIRVIFHTEVEANIKLEILAQ